MRADAAARRPAARPNGGERARQRRAPGAGRDPRGLRLHPPRGAGRPLHAGPGAARARAPHVAQRRAARRARMAPVESFRFPSADGTDIEAFLTRPLGADGDLAPSADRDDPRRPARPAGPGLHRQGAGLRGAGLGLADGQLPRLHRLRPGAGRQDLRRPERRRGQRRRRRRGRGAGALPVDRPRPGSASRAPATAGSSPTGSSPRPIASRRPSPTPASATS